MGTMQFMAVPYALYAAKSLEPGPAGPPGPKGDPGDPATDDQQLSYNRNEQNTFPYQTVHPLGLIRGKLHSGRGT